MTTTTRTRLTKLDRDIETVRQDLEMQEKYLSGLLHLREVIAGDVMKRARQPKPRGYESRSAALVEVLKEADRPLTTDEMLKGVARRGLHVEKRSIYPTLSYLHKKGLARPVERGHWAAAA